MKLSSLLKPNYLYYRLKQKYFELTHPDLPWLSRSAILLLDNWLKPTDIGFEWGSGRSTIWFAKRVKKIISIEDNHNYYLYVKSRIIKEKLNDKIDLNFIPCELCEQDEPETHLYADFILNFPDEYFDFILVDGNIRILCMERAISKIKRGGMLILDNANRYIPNKFLNKYTTVHEPRNVPRSQRWEKLIYELKQWRWLNASDGIWDTRFWVRV